MIRHLWSSDVHRVVEAGVGCAHYKGLMDHELSLRYCSLGTLCFATPSFCIQGIDEVQASVSKLSRALISAAFPGWWK